MAYHIDMHTVCTGIVADERLGSFTIRGGSKTIVLITKDLRALRLSVLERYPRTVHLQRCQAVVIDHLYIVQVDFIHLTAACRSGARRLVGRKGNQHIRC